MKYTIRVMLGCLALVSMSTLKAPFFELSKPLAPKNSTGSPASRSAGELRTTSSASAERQQLAKTSENTSVNRPVAGRSEGLAFGDVSGKSEKTKPLIEEAKQGVSKVTNQASFGQWFSNLLTSFMDMFPTRGVVDSLQEVSKITENISAGNHDSLKPFEGDLKQLNKDISSLTPKQKQQLQDKMSELAKQLKNLKNSKSVGQSSEPVNTIMTQLTQEVLKLKETSARLQPENSSRSSIMLDVEAARKMTEAEALELEGKSYTSGSSSSGLYVSKALENAVKPKVVDNAPEIEIDAPSLQLSSSEIQRSPGAVPKPQKPVRPRSTATSEDIAPESRSTAQQDSFTGDSMTQSALDRYYATGNNLVTGRQVPVEVGLRLASPEQPLQNVALPKPQKTNKFSNIIPKFLEEDSQQFLNRRSDQSNKIVYRTNAVRELEDYVASAKKDDADSAPDNLFSHDVVRPSSMPRHAPPPVPSASLIPEVNDSVRPSSMPRNAPPPVPSASLMPEVSDSVRSSLMSSATPSASAASPLPFLKDIQQKTFSKPASSMTVSMTAKEFLELPKERQNELRQDPNFKEPIPAPPAPRPAKSSIKPSFMADIAGGKDRLKPVETQSQYGAKPVAVEKGFNTELLEKVQKKTQKSLTEDPEDGDWDDYSEKKK